MSQTDPEPRFPAVLATEAAANARRRLLTEGASDLSSTELLSLILGGAGGADHGWRVAERLTRKWGLRGLAGFTPERWRREEGLGVATAARLAASFELARRTAGRARSPRRPPVHSPRLAWRLVRDLGERRREHLVGLYLDAQSRLLRRETVSIGAVNTTRAHPREILRPAIEHHASALVLAHNHPSGSPEPSPEDVAFTRAAAQASALMGIELFDHLIVVRDDFTSLRERGVLPGV